jgi:tetratricopeptide (TPR) repeat protein
MNDTERHGFVNFSVFSPSTLWSFLYWAHKFAHRTKVQTTIMNRLLVNTTPAAFTTLLSRHVEQQHPFVLRDSIHRKSSSDVNNNNNSINSNNSMAAVSSRQQDDAAAATAMPLLGRAMLMETLPMMQSPTPPSPTHDHHPTTTTTPCVSTGDHHHLHPTPEETRQQHPVVPYDEGMWLYRDDVLPCTLTMNMTPDTIAWYNSAQQQMLQGEYTSALGCWKDVLEQQQQQQQLDATNMMQSALLCHRIHHSIGYCCYRVGNNLEAKQSYHRSFAIATESHLAPIHIAAARNALAVLQLLEDTSQANETITILRECYDVYVQQFGIHSCEAATILNNVARAQYLSGNNFQHALESFELCLHIRLHLLGYNSMDVAVTICNIGQTYHRLGQYELALEKYHIFVYLCHEYFCSNQRDVATIVLHMADIYAMQGNVSTAKIYYQHVLELRRVFGDHIADRNKIMFHLGNIYYDEQEYDTALQCYMECIQMEQNNIRNPPPQTTTIASSSTLDDHHHHDYHSNMIPILMKIAVIQRHRKCYMSALQVFAKLHGLQLQLYGPNSNEVARTVSYMGLTCYEQRDLAMALTYYVDALHIQLINNLYEDSSEVASTLNSIGLVLFHQGLYDHAKSCFVDSLRMKIKFLGPHHHDVAILWYNIASTYYDQGNTETAILYFKEVIRIEREKPTVPQSDTTNVSSSCCGLVRTLQKLGTIYMGNGELTEAMEYFTQALDAEQAKGPGQCHDRCVAKLYNCMGNIHLQRAEVAEMMDCYMRASRLYRRIQNHHTASFSITGYTFYYLSRMHPPSAAAA